MEEFPFCEVSPEKQIAEAAYWEAESRRYEYGQFVARMAALAEEGEVDEEEG
jgi:hypothetical protein